jgi:hypothetical protein
LLVTIALFSAASVMRAQTLVEFSMDKAPLDHGVGTCVYDPTDTEKFFFDRLSEERQMTVESGPGDSGEAGETFSLAGHQGQFVSWLGIVRHIMRVGWPHHGRLLIQNTYFTGLTDCHTQTVEINGAGDFEADLLDLPDEVIPLVLVRVYGRVRGGNDGLPVIDADYVRVWHFFQFNFMDYGVDHSNPEWRSRIKLPPDETVYHIGVSRRYYEERLGPTPQEEAEIADYHRRQTELEFERGGLETFDSSPTYIPTEWEKDYLDDFPPDQRITVQSKPGEVPSTAFHLTDHLNQRVSWFGVVREVKPDGIGKRGGSLLIENKYFNGAKDEKLQTVSIRGAGNFVAQVSNLSEELTPLLLVRIYGRVLREENGVPVVKVKFLRGWHVGQYNFDDYGEDHGDPRWTKNIRLKSSEPIRQTKVSADYYIDRLGPTREQEEKVREAFRWMEQDRKQRQETQSVPEEIATISPSPSP